MIALRPAVTPPSFPAFPSCPQFTFVTRKVRTGSPISCRKRGMRSDRRHPTRSTLDAERVQAGSLRIGSPGRTMPGSTTTAQTPRRRRSLRELIQRAASMPNRSANFAQPLCGLVVTSMTAVPTASRVPAGALSTRQVEVDDQLVAGQLPPVAIGAGDGRERTAVHDVQLPERVGTTVGCLAVAALDVVVADDADERAQLGRRRSTSRSPCDGRRTTSSTVPTIARRPDDVFDLVGEPIGDGERRRAGCWSFTVRRSSMSSTSVSRVDEPGRTDRFGRPRRSNAASSTSYGLVVDDVEWSRAAGRPMRHAAHTRLITPPYASDHGALTTSAIHPVIGPPIGVEPRNATACNAISRLRMSDGDSCCEIALAARDEAGTADADRDRPGEGDPQVRGPRHADPADAEDDQVHQQPVHRRPGAVGP